jgi:hypothetical protein
MQKSNLDSSAPWWKFGHVWMVFAGPAVVVVASFITLYLALTSPNEMVYDEYPRKGGETSKTAAGELDLTKSASMAPALQARNHAQTGVIPAPQATKKP